MKIYIVIEYDKQENYSIIINVHQYKHLAEIDKYILTKALNKQLKQRYEYIIETKELIN